MNGAKTTRPQREKEKKRMEVHRRNLRRSGNALLRVRVSACSRKRKGDGEIDRRVGKEMGGREVKLILYYDEAGSH